MKILALDTSTMMASCAVMDDTRVLGEYSISQEMSHSERIVPMIDEILKGLDMKIDDIDLYAVARGPGSFTGLRIGVATMKAFAHMFDKAIIGVATIEGLAFNLPHNDIVVPMIDARRNRVYTGIYSWKVGKLHTIMKADALEIDELLDRLGKEYDNVTVNGDGSLLYREKIEKALGAKVNYSTMGLNYCRASSIGELALIKYNEGYRDDYYALVPDYLRKSQAERELEKKEQ